MYLDIEMLSLVLFFPVAFGVYLLDQNYFVNGNDKQISAMKAAFIACLLAPLLAFFIR
jgi:hypothetical protein